MFNNVLILFGMMEFKSNEKLGIKFSMYKFIFSISEPTWKGKGGEST